MNAIGDTKIESRAEGDTVHVALKVEFDVEAFKRSLKDSIIFFDQRWFESPSIEEALKCR